MKLEKTYVIQTYNFLRGWEDRQQDFGGLMQVMHYTQKREAIRTAVNVMNHARQRKVGCWMRVVQREWDSVSLDDGCTVETTWEDCYAPNGQCSDCGSILRLAMNTNADNGFGRMVLPEHITIHGIRCACPNFAISDL